MIRCPKCGTLNRDGSRFCNECGAPLQHTKTRCPVCGALNPVGNLFCDRCHARLVPLEVPPEAASPLSSSPPPSSSPALKGISLPSRAVAPDDAASEIPDWLFDLTQEQSVPELEELEAPAPAEGLPDWLSGLAPEEPTAEPEVAPAAGETPDWLSGLAPEEPTAEPEAPAPAADETPDWLSGLAPEEPTAEPEAPAPAEGLPDWLSGLAPEEPMAEPEVPAPVEGLPDWLLSIADHTQPLVSSTSRQMPSWLLASADEAYQQRTPPPHKPLPDWLAGLGEEAPSAPEEPVAAQEEVAPAEELPDWLAGSGEESPSAPEEPVAAQEEVAPAEELPDWLAGLGEEAPSAPEEPVAAQEEVAPAEELPDWLAGLGEEETPADEVVEVSEVPQTTVPAGEIPDWLNELEPVEEDEDEITITKPPERKVLVQANMPDWLRQLKPPGTGPLPEEAVESVDSDSTLDETILPSADIPDWVKQLQPKKGAAGGRTPPRGATEEEGPLSGLQGLLPAAAIVDMPDNYQPGASFKIPDAVIEQAKLWQSLLEQPPAVARPVAQTQAPPLSSGKVGRWIVTLVLWLSAMAGILGVFLTQNHPQIAHAPLRPNVKAFDSAINSLQAGNSVVLAIEYGAAEADEMSPMAETVLAQLQARQVGVQIVSTLPEGGGLSRQLFARQSLTATSAFTLTSVRYLAGMENGIAGYLSRQQSQVNLIIVLTSRSERVRWWVEQNNILPEPVPLVVGTSAAVGPLVEPYLESSGVLGWLAGFPDTVAYDGLRPIPNPVYARMLDALMLTHWAAGGLLILGAVFSLLAGRKVKKGKL